MSTDSDPLARIARLRQDIALLDRQILSFVARRMRIAQEIGDCKRRAGLPVRDFRVEVEVLERTRRTCESLGLDAELGATLFGALIEGAVRTQHGLAERKQGGTRKSVLVVGGCGRMGSWLCHYFAAGGHRVTIYDTAGQDVSGGFKRAKNLREAVKGSDLIAVATPLGATPKVMESIVSAAPSGLVFDICSLKTPLLSVAQRAVEAGVRMASLHPMFAPGTVLLSGRVLVVCNCGNAEAAKEARALFEETALRLVDLPLGEHDRMMAYVLGLSHAVNIAFARTLSTSGLTLQDMDHVASTTFSKQIRTTREVALENPELYYEIQHYNGHTANVLQSLAEAIQTVRTAALADDDAGFAALMAGNRAYFEGA